MREIVRGGSKKTMEEGRATFDGPVTMFKSVGLGLQDVAIACAVVEKAEETIAKSSTSKIGVLVDSYDKAV